MIVASRYNEDVVNRLVMSATLVIAKEKIVFRGGSEQYQIGKCIDTLEQNAKDSGIVSELDMRVIEDSFVKNCSFVQICRVPGAYEIPQAAQLLASRGLCDAIIALGCVIKDETKHFDVIANACTTGLTCVAQDFTRPLGHGVLFVHDEKQAMAHAGMGDFPSPDGYGAEAAQAVWEMLKISLTIDSSTNKEPPP